MKQPKVNFYNLAWRWHFYAGLFVAPFMVMLALTGTLYLFKPQLDPLMYGSLMTVPADHHTVSADDLLKRVKEAYPQATIKQYLPPVNAERSAQFVVINGGTELNVFIDPYHGDILGEQDAKNNLQAIARAIHGELMIGTVGDRLIEMAAGWGIVLVVSGVFLWWPRGQAAGILWPRLSSRGRVLWRDLHAVTGFWGASLLLVMLLSGMTWTGFWGQQYAGVWNVFPAAMWDNVPTSDVEARSLNTATRQTVPWAMENTPMPMSGGDHAEHMAHGGAQAGPAAPTISLQDVQKIAVQRKVEPGYSITFPKTATGVFTIAVFADDPRNDATLHVDQYTGDVLADVRYEQYGPVARATEIGVMLHEGKMFGVVNQIIVLLICLMILLSAVSGVVIWWKRRPQGKFGVPPLRHDLPKWKTAMVIMFALAVMFPLVGASLVVVWVLDRVLLSRLTRQTESASSSS
ncbi:PepSY domain-containing protein [Pseudomonas sp. SIMBA_041]|uniref:PepSY-associated TM helix domain-containing protein n=1 Tax=Pseudomonas sp. SIMBA_041 TaxID=3085782 RepID=UPI00397A7B40